MKLDNTPNDFDQFDRIRKMLERTGGVLHVIERQVPVEMQMVYFKEADKLRKTGIRVMTDDELDTCDHRLTDPETTDDDRRFIMLTLATSKSIKAYRILERYADVAESELSDWAYMALMESRIALESELSDERRIYISSGLGGRDHKLRFYLVFVSASGEPFLDYQRQVIEREFDYAFSKNDCEVERLTICDNYVELVMLMPVMVDTRMLFHKLLSECNQYGNFLSPSFVITNTKELNDEEIQQVIRNLSEPEHSTAEPTDLT